MRIKRNLSRAREIMGELNEKYASKNEDGTKKSQIAIASETEGLDVEFIPTGIYPLDIALGGGVPYGRILGVDGLQSTGKTLMVILMCSAFQRHCRYCRGELSKRDGHIVVNEKTGECFSLKDFLDVEFYFWKENAGYRSENKKIAKPIFDKWVEEFLKTNDITISKETSEVRKLLKANNLLIEKDTVYSCKCGKAEPMMVLWVDSERSFDRFWAESLGLDLDLVTVLPNAVGEHVVDQVLYVVRDGSFDVIVIDSLANLVSLDSLGKSAESRERYGERAKIISELERKLDAYLTEKIDLSNKSQPIPTVLQINHLRENITDNPYAEKYVRCGGGEQGYHEAISIRMSKTKHEKNQERPTFVEISCQMKKNKVAPPFRKAVFQLYIDDDPKAGFSTGETNELKFLIDDAMAKGIIEKVGSRAYTYKYKDIETSSVSKMKTELVESGLISEVRRDTMNAILRKRTA